MLSMFKKTKILISGLGSAWSIQLVVSELIYGNYCPKLSGIPACYLVLLAYLMVLVSTVSPRKRVYVLGTVLGLLIGIWFTSRQLLGIEQCPAFWGIPLCYLSFAAFALLGVLGLLSRK